MSKIPYPTPKEVNKWLQKWKKSKNYTEQEETVKLVFSTFPENEKIEHILAKISILNDFYSLHIFGTHTVAKQVENKHIDAPLKRGDKNIVNKITPIRMGKEKKIRKMYSFASKYCSHHQPEHYPIYDYFVEKMLVHWKENSDFGKFHNFTNQYLKDYSKFKKIIDKFIKYFNLERYTYKEIDVYLWQAGKKYFQKKYPKKNQKKL